MKKTHSRIVIDRLWLAVAVGCFAGPAAHAVTDYRDQLEKAVDVPEDIAQQDTFQPFVGDSFTYDSNLFRLPKNVDLTTLTGVGGTPSRFDYINDATGGFGAQWLFGNRQSLGIGAKVDYNSYVHNTYLNNLATDDSIIWNWGLGSALTGQIGATYSRQLQSFLNTAVYSRNMINIQQYFAGGRWQVGPHVALFAGTMYSTYGLTDSNAKTNDSHTKSADFGADFSTSAQTTVGFDYRYTDSRFPNPIDIGGFLFEPDYREDRARVVASYVLSDKTTFNANAGYLRRQYANSVIGDFTGWIGRFTTNYQITDKTLVSGTVYRQLAADLTQQTDYFVATGVQVGPQWSPSEKITIAAGLAYDHRSYLGVNTVPPSQVTSSGPPPVVISGAQRRDSFTSELVSFTYNPIAALAITANYVHDHRNSNQDVFQFDDNRASIQATFKFGAAMP
jgi:exopolysaccharide biosynthesis operon protein EpsL